jgi:hypothetical protein
MPHAQFELGIKTRGSENGQAELLAKSVSDNPYTVSLYLNENFQINPSTDVIRFRRPGFRGRKAPETGMADRRRRPGKPAENGAKKGLKWLIPGSKKGP